MEPYRHLVFNWSALPDKIYPGKKYSLSAEGRVVAWNPNIGGSDTMLIAFREAFGAGGAFLPDTHVSAKAAQPVNIDIVTKPGSPDKNNSFHYGYVIFNFGIKTTTSEMYKYVYEWVEDNAKLADEAGGAAQSSSAEKLLFNNWNGSSCSTTGTMEFSLPQRAFVSHIVTWSDSRIARGSMNGVLDGPLGVIMITSKPGNCDPEQRQWCDRIFTISKELPVGSYSITVDSNSVCQNSGSGGVGFTQVYGQER